ncbi:tRNA-modifying enzyme [Candidatus Pacearchaeota archaeon RBG_13_36_9]|nr:MAG: tRNA-modifying enzyme [Candidatus Pacearchaeota archaeon RBG_13_36_9]
MRTRNRKSKITATGDFKKILKKQKYFLVGEHSAVQLCGWTKKSLLNGGECYKEKFYGIKSHECCQMSPWMKCQNKCLHCWRPIELDMKIDGKIEKPEELVENCIKAQKKLLTGFGGYKETDKKKYKEAQEPSQFAISLIGEPTLYPGLADFILELRKQGKTSFLVTNGLQPAALKKMQDGNCLPTQLYVSLLYPDEEMFRKITGNKEADSWKKYNETLELLKSLKTRTVIRMTLIKELNSDEKYLEKYAELIKKASPLFIEIKSYMAVGFSKNREGMGLKKMLFHEEIKNFSEKLLKFLRNYRFLDEKKESRVVLLGKDRERMMIKKEGI